jgi:hypothetical protein
MKSALLAVVSILVIVSCTKIDYVGEEYPPTMHVDLNFSEADVERDYKVMGHVIASAGDFVSAEKMQAKLVEKAKEKGADGVVILGLDRYVTGGSTSYSETTTTKEKKGGTETTVSGSSSSSSEEKKEIKAIFVKYR